jgi:Tfp pilus assembly protein PilF
VDAQRGQSSPGEREDLQAAAAIEQGIQHLEKHEDDRAIACFTEAIRLNPACARAYHLRGQVYSKAGKWALAERDVAKARRAEAKQP